MNKMIPFNKPYLTGKEISFMSEAVNENSQISGNGPFTKKCQSFFEKKYNVKKTLLTTSCTDALEMAALLLDIKPGDEVIVPSYTFVSTALAFVRQGAKIVFCDSRSDHPGIDEDSIEKLITNRTKVIVPVHYAGVACDMDKIMSIANKYNIWVVEDAAQAIDSYYKGKPLGGIGHLGCFSFHETKNIQCGEGGMLVINDNRFVKRAEIIWEKGTNRAEFFRGEINKYGWVDIGSSFLPSDLLAAFLYAQFIDVDKIQNRRKEIWNKYYEEIERLNLTDNIKLPVIPEFGVNNGHMFYVQCKSIKERSELINYLKLNNIYSVFHYMSLHNSEYYNKNNNGAVLINCEKYEETILRLPFYFDLTDKEITYIVHAINKFYEK